MPAAVVVVAHGGAPVVQDVALVRQGVVLDVDVPGRAVRGVTVLTFRGASAAAAGAVVYLPLNYTGDAWRVRCRSAADPVWRTCDVLSAVQYGTAAEGDPVEAEMARLWRARQCELLVRLCPNGGAPPAGLLSGLFEVAVEFASCALPSSCVLSESQAVLSSRPGDARQWLPCIDSFGAAPQWVVVPRRESGWAVRAGPSRHVAAAACLLVVVLSYTAGARGDPFHVSAAAAPWAEVFSVRPVPHGVLTVMRAGLEATAKVLGAAHAPPLEEMPIPTAEAEDDDDAAASLRELDREAPPDEYRVRFVLVDNPPSFILDDGVLGCGVVVLPADVWTVHDVLAEPRILHSAAKALAWQALACGTVRPHSYADCWLHYGTAGAAAWVALLSWGGANNTAAWLARTASAVRERLADEPVVLAPVDGGWVDPELSVVGRPAAAQKAVLVVLQLAAMLTRVSRGAPHDAAAWLLAVAKLAALLQGYAHAAGRGERGVEWRGFVNYLAVETDEDLDDFVATWVCGSALPALDACVEYNSEQQILEGAARRCGPGSPAVALQLAVVTQDDIPVNPDPAAAAAAAAACTGTDYLTLVCPADADVGSCEVYHARVDTPTPLAAFPVQDTPYFKQHPVVERVCLTLPANAYATAERNPIYYTRADPRQLLPLAAVRVVQPPHRWLLQAVHDLSVPGRVAAIEGMRRFAEDAAARARELAREEGEPLSGGVVLGLPSQGAGASALAEAAVGDVLPGEYLRQVCLDEEEHYSVRGAALAALQGCEDDPSRAVVEGFVARYAEKRDADGDGDAEAACTAPHRALVDALVLLPALRSLAAGSVSPCDARLLTAATRCCPGGGGAAPHASPSLQRAALEVVHSAVRRVARMPAPAADHRSALTALVEAFLPHAPEAPPPPAGAAWVGCVATLAALSADAAHPLAPAAAELVQELLTAGAPAEPTLCLTGSTPALRAAGAFEQIWRGGFGGDSALRRATERGLASLGAASEADLLAASRNGDWAPYLPSVCIDDDATSAAPPAAVRVDAGALAGVLGRMRREQAVHAALVHRVYREVWEGAVSGAYRASELEASWEQALTGRVAELEQRCRQGPVAAVAGEPQPQQAKVMEMEKEKEKEAVGGRKRLRIGKAVSKGKQEKDAARTPPPPDVPSPAAAADAVKRRRVDPPPRPPPTAPTAGFTLTVPRRAAAAVDALVEYRAQLAAAPPLLELLLWTSGGAAPTPVHSMVVRAPAALATALHPATGYGEGLPPKALCGETFHHTQRFCWWYTVRGRVPIAAGGFYDPARLVQRVGAKELSLHVEPGASGVTSLVLGYAPTSVPTVYPCLPAGRVVWEAGGADTGDSSAYAALNAVAWRRLPRLWLHCKPVAELAGYATTVPPVGIEVYPAWFGTAVAKALPALDWTTTTTALRPAAADDVMYATTGGVAPPGVTVFRPAPSAAEHQRRLRAVSPAHLVWGERTAVKNTAVTNYAAAVSTLPPLEMGAVVAVTGPGGEWVPLDDVVLVMGAWGGAPVALPAAWRVVLLGRLRAAPNAKLLARPLQLAVSRRVVRCEVAGATGDALLVVHLELAAHCAADAVETLLPIDAKCPVAGTTCALPDRCTVPVPAVPHVYDRYAPGCLVVDANGGLHLLIAAERATRRAVVGNYLFAAAPGAAHPMKWAAVEQVFAERVASQEALRLSFTCIRPSA